MRDLRTVTREAAGLALRARGAVIAVVLALGLAVAPPVATPVAAADPLRLAADATYTVQPEAGRVQVVIDVAATNLQPNAGNVVYFYREVAFAVHREASGIRATDGSGQLVTTITRHRDYGELEVRLRSRLFYQQTTRFQIRYLLVGGAPRSESETRVGLAFASFGVWAWGDAGRSTVHVRTPPGFRSEILGSELEIVNSPDGQQLRASPDDPSTFYTIVAAENRSAYERTRVSLEGGVEVVILAWPEDDDWSATVVDTLRHGLPGLRQLVGLEWPVDKDLEVRERFTPLLDGYAGVFYDDQSIDVSEDLDPLVIVHEASHAWFDERLFAERWIYEGLAEEYAWRVQADVGAGGPAPGQPSRTSEARVALTTWTHPGVIRDDQGGERERWGYDAAWWVIHVVVEETGEARMREVLAAAQDDLTAYPGAGSPETVAPADGWKRLLDLVEGPIGPRNAALESAFVDFVIRPADRSLLETRAETRSAYRALVAAGDGWLPSWYVRQPLGAWWFEAAGARVEEAAEVLGLRDEVATAADALDLRPNGALRDAYENGIGGFDAATELAGQQLATLTAIASARAALTAERDLLTTVGLLDANPDAPYASAREAFEAGRLDEAVTAAGTAAAIIAGAAAIGQGRVLLAASGLVALLLLLAAALVLRRRRRRRAAVLVAIAAESAATLVPGTGLAPATGPDATEAYATLAADPGALPDPPADPAPNGGAAEGGSAVDP